MKYLNWQLYAVPDVIASYNSIPLDYVWETLPPLRWPKPKGQILRWESKRNEEHRNEPLEVKNLKRLHRSQPINSPARQDYSLPYIHQGFPKRDSLSHKFSLIPGVSPPGLFESDDDSEEDYRV